MPIRLAQTIAGEPVPVAIRSYEEQHVDSGVEEQAIAVRRGFRRAKVGPPRAPKVQAPAGCKAKMARAGAGVEERGDGDTLEVVARDIVGVAGADGDGSRGNDAESVAPDYASYFWDEVWEDKKLGSLEGASIVSICASEGNGCLIHTLWTL